jgi:lon-related putative ATP-dependent protease
MNPAAPLSWQALRWQCSPEQFAFQTTAELAELDEIVGQSRAWEAVQFGVAMKGDGYNIYALGPPGIGKRTAVEHCLKERCGAENSPSDWCYVNNFEDIRRPKTLRLPTGRGVSLRKDVESLIDDLETAINTALESDEHKNRVQEFVNEAGEQQESSFRRLSDKANSMQVQLLRTPVGFALAPMKGTEVMSPEDYQKLSKDEQAQVTSKVELLQKELQKVVEQVPKLQKETRDKIRELNREAVRLAIGHLLAKSKEYYNDLPQVVAYFEAMEKDILERVDEFQPSEEGQVAMFGASNPQKPSFDDYAINLLVDNSSVRGAPVVYEDHPSYQNLIGRVEHESQMGALLTDFTLIEAGALHRANGGYLLLEALRLLQQPYAWEGLKRALTSRSIKIESLGEALSLISTVSLEPDPIPMDVKVVLLGDRMLYYLLYQFDPEFAELFKVSADFDDEMDRSPDHCLLLARLVGTYARREKLRPLTRTAVARLLEHAARVAEDSQKLTTRMRTLADIVREADYWAERANQAVIDEAQLSQAIDQQIHRVDRLRHRIHEEIESGTILIDTQGSQVAQVNGLSVIDLGNFRFGQPSRITATARLGPGEVINIERQAKLSGAIHSKGVLILSSYLAARFAKSQPLSLSASLVFEQSYGMVDGDSASVAELCVLLSAIAEVPLKQNFAVTGSINQHGHVQAIGGVNEKIEGFFDVCSARGLTGDQGVLIPDSNIRHLMLRPDVVEACATGRFHIHSIATIDQAMALLSGIEAGLQDDQGGFRLGSFNQRVASRLQELSRLQRRKWRRRHSASPVEPKEAPP